MKTSTNTIQRVLFLAVMAGMAASAAGAQSPSGQDKQATPAAKPAAALAPYRNQPARVSTREAAILESVWGISSPTVRAVESGVMIRFNFRVLDPVKAKPLMDKKLNPELDSPERGLKLVIPTMEKVGQLRQAPSEIEAGKSYWMAFSNSGSQVKPGDRVDVVIGNFHVRGLVVE
jgi:hypothetical protein